MSNLLSDMPFLPASAPTNPVVDCAGVLSSARLSELNAQAAQAYFKPCVIILPANFSPQSMAQACSNITQQWHVSDNSFLMVINLSGHNLRIVPGPALRSAGLTDRKITQIIAIRFGPHMRRVHSANGLTAALPDAISDTINGVNETVGHGRKILSHSGTPSTLVTPGAPNSPLTGTVTMVAIAAILAVVLSFLYLKRRGST